MKGRAALILASLAAALSPLFSRSPAPLAGSPPFPGWPPALAGAIELPLSPVETRRLAGLPGRMARFRLGREEVVVAWVHGPTRLLHPADDCFRGLGYTITPLPLERDADGHLWSLRRATRGGDSLRVRERLEAADGRSFSDVSSWYWSALLGTSRGPWWHWRAAAPEPAPG